MTGYIDEVHRWAHLSTEQIRQHVTVLRSQAAVWQPGPCPSEWGRYQPINRTKNRRSY